MKVLCFIWGGGGRTFSFQANSCYSEGKPRRQALGFGGPPPPRTGSSPPCPPTTRPPASPYRQAPLPSRRQPPAESRPRRGHQAAAASHRSGAVAAPVPPGLRGLTAGQGRAGCSQLGRGGGVWGVCVSQTGSHRYGAGPRRRSPRPYRALPRSYPER